MVPRDAGPSNDNLSHQLIEELAHCVPRGDMGEIYAESFAAFFCSIDVDKVKREGIKVG